MARRRVIWQCSCEGRVEADTTDPVQRRLLRRFVKAHERCPDVWAERWNRLAGDRGDLASVTERRVGFYADDWSDVGCPRGGTA
jgi:hypothetical protein